MTTTATERDLSEYTGKSVTVVRKLAEPNEKGESAIEVECKVQVGNDTGLLVKPKGKVQFDLIPVSEIEDVYLTPDKAKKLVASKIQHPQIGNVRRHLLDRHGVTLKWANDTTEEAAKSYHDSLNHEELDLGHVHVEKKADEAPAEES